MLQIRGRVYADCSLYRRWWVAVLLLPMNTPESYFPKVEHARRRFGGRLVGLMAYRAIAVRGMIIHDWADRLGPRDLLKTDGET